MKKTVFASLLTVATLIGVAAPSAAFAAPVDMKSDSTVTFTEDKGDTKPKDPTKPDEKNPGKPKDPVKPGTAGPLSIDFASNFKFGTTAITSDNATYYAKPQGWVTAAGKDEDRPNYVQVSDKRGTFEGWTLKVKQDKQFAVKDDQTKELDGAQLKFTNGTLASVTDAKYAPTAKNEFTLTPGATQEMPVEAAKDHGMGTWIYRFGDNKSAGSSVELSVPGATPKMAKEYVTSITWSLETTPANP